VDYGSWQQQKRLERAARALGEQLGTRKAEQQKIIRDFLANFRGQEILSGLYGERPIAVPHGPDPSSIPAGSVKIPYYSRAAMYAPLARCIKQTGDECNVGPYAVAKIMSFFFQFIADEVSWGNLVRIPGYGVFGSWWYDGRGRPPCAQPRFVPARPFRMQTAFINEKEKAILNRESLLTFRRSHHITSKNTWGGHVGGTMERVRESWQNEPGYPPDDPNVVG
jgi:hypothetical protein